jgi:hypothetical protein
MFIQFSTEQMEQYFNQVNRSLGRMPQQDRAELHQELRQHLEALFATHMELGVSPEEAFAAALNQFGEPRKIGRRMFQEWRKDRKKKQAFACLPAALYALLWIMGMEAISISTICLIDKGYGGNLLVRAFEEIDGLVHEGLSENGYAGDLLGLWAGAFAFYGIPVIAGLVTGWKFRERALPGLFYAMLPFSVLFVLAYGFHFSLFGLTAVFWSPLSSVVAYGVSALRRGKVHQPAWSELLLRLK